MEFNEILEITVLVAIAIELFALYNHTKLDNRIDEHILDSNEELSKFESFMTVLRESVSRYDEHMIRFDEHMTRFSERLSTIDEHIIRTDERMRRLDDHMHALLDELLNNNVPRRLGLDAVSTDTERDKRV